MEPEVQAVQDAINNDPEIQAALRQIETMRRQGVPLIGMAGSSQPSIMRWAQQNLAPLLQSKGIQMPHDYGISLGQDGPIGELTRRGFWDRNSDWLAPVVMAGMGGAAGLASLANSGGAGAGAGAGAATGAGATGAGAAGATGAGAATGAGTAAGAGTTAATSSVLTPNIASGFTLGGTGVGTGTGAATGLGAGAATGAGSAMSWGSVLTNLARDPNTWATAADMLGRMGSGQADERALQNMSAQEQNRLLASVFGTEQGAASRAAEAEEASKMNRAQFGISAPSARARQAVLGSLIANLQPVQFGNTGRVQVPTITGGLTPAALSEATRGAGRALEAQAIDALLSGSDMPEETDFQAARLPAPEFTPYQQPGTGESILSGIGAAGSGFSAVMENLRRQSTTPSLGTPTTARG